MLTIGLGSVRQTDLSCAKSLESRDREGEQEMQAQVHSPHSLGSPWEFTNRADTEDFLKE